MLKIDLSGKRAFVAGVADDGGFGFAIAKALAEAGASVCVGTWPPAFGIFTTLLERGKFEDSLALPDGGELAFERIYRARRRVRHARGRARTSCARAGATRTSADFTIQGVADRFKADFGEPLDIVVHSLANGPEVKKPLLETSRKGYLSALRLGATRSCRWSSASVR